jgi:hypothetical protein
MKIIITEETLKSKIEFEKLHLDHSYGEDFYVLRAKVGDKVIAFLKYGVYENEPNIKMIEVDKAWRRMGIATDMIKKLQALYPDTEIDLGYATDDGGKFIKSLNRKFYPNAQYKKLTERLSKVTSEINRIISQMDKEDYSESPKLDDLYDEQYEIQDQLQDMKSGKWLIEGMLTELLTKKNVAVTNSKVSKVYMGGNWVKKIKNPNTNTGENYSKEELLQYQIMVDNQSSGIFPPTIIRILKDRGGNRRPVILQKKVNVDSQALIYHKILRNIEPIQFRTILEVIAMRGVSNSMQDELEEVHEILTPELSKYFDEYVNVSKKLYEIRKKYHLEYGVDLHSTNYGFYNGKIVIIDFSSPFLKMP